MAFLFRLHVNEMFPKLDQVWPDPRHRSVYYRFYSSLQIGKRQLGFHGQLLPSTGETNSGYSQGFNAFYVNITCNICNIEMAYALCIHTLFTSTPNPFFRTKDLNFVGSGDLSQQRIRCFGRLDPDLLIL